MTVDFATLLFVALAVALAPILADLSGPLRLPVVVIEVALGIVIGPQMLDLAKPEPTVQFLGAGLGMAFLFFMAGLEIDFQVIRGWPVRLALIGWSISLVVALVMGLGLRVEGVVISGLLVGAAVTTTALGTLVPILRDAGVLGTPFGTAALAVGAIGELCPIVFISLFLTPDKRPGTAVLLVVFAVATVLAAVVAMKVRPARLTRVVRATMHASGQLAVRLCVLLIVALIVMASEMGLDVVLGAFAAGIVAGLVLRAPAAEPVRVKLEGMAFGLFVPIFFIYSGMTFDLDALLGSTTAMLKLPLFLGLFLVARGTSALLYRGRIPNRELLPLGLLASTALPLVVAITQIGTETGRMAADTAAALVGAGMISVLIFPASALALLRREPGAKDRVPVVAPPSTNEPSPEGL